MSAAAAPPSTGPADPPPSSTTSSTSSTSSVALPTSSSSPHARLLAKQTIIDQWSTREKLFLVSVVSSSGGDQNWVSVARTMKGAMSATLQASSANNEDDGNAEDPADHPDARPADWYSQKNCALQYDQMLEKHERDAPPISRRTKRSSESGGGGGGAGGSTGGGVGTGASMGSGGAGPGGFSASATPDPAQVIAKKLKDERTKELMTLVEHTNRVMANLMEEIDELEDDDISEERLDEIEREMAEEEAEERAQKRARELEMKERERKKLELAAALRSGAAAKPLTGAASASVQAAKERRLSEATEAANNAQAQIATPSTPSQSSAKEGETTEPIVLETPGQTPADESSDQKSPLLSLLLQSPSAAQSNPSTTPTSPVSASTTGSTTNTPSKSALGAQPMSEGLQNMFDKVSGAETRATDEKTSENSTLTERNGGAGDSSTLSKLLALPPTDKGRLPDVKELASETGISGDDGEVSQSTTKIEDEPDAVKKEDENEDVEVDVEQDSAKDETIPNAPAQSIDEKDEANPQSDTAPKEQESQPPRSTRSQKEIEAVEDKKAKSDDVPEPTATDKDEKESEDEDKKRLPPPSTVSVTFASGAVSTTTTISSDSTTPTVNMTNPPAAAETVTPPPNVRSSKRTTSEKSEDNEDETSGSTRGRRTSKRTSASNPDAVADEESNPAIMPENRRLSRIRGAATGVTNADDGSGSSRGRRGSGATSRSSSPTGSEDTVRDESESEHPNTPSGAGLVRSTRSRRRSGIRPPGLAVEESAPNSPASTPTAVESGAKSEAVESGNAGATSGGVSSTAATSDTTTTAITGGSKPPLTSSLTSTGGSSSGVATPTGSGKPFKRQGLLILNNIQTHQFALTFETAMSAKSAPDYPNIILRPMDLKTIKSNLGAGTVSNMHEMFRDLTLMLLNATMFSPTGSQTHKDAMAFYRFVQEQMQEFMGAHLLATSSSSASEGAPPSSASPMSRSGGVAAPGASTSTTSTTSGSTAGGTASSSSKMKTKGRREDRKRAAEDTPTSSSTSSSKKRKR